jgi:hypothetical protein
MGIAQVAQAVLGHFAGSTTSHTSRAPDVFAEGLCTAIQNGVQAAANSQRALTRLYPSSSAAAQSQLVSTDNAQFLGETACASTARTMMGHFKSGTVEGETLQPFRGMMGPPSSVIHHPD